MLLASPSSSSASSAHQPPFYIRRTSYVSPESPVGQRHAGPAVLRGRNTSPALGETRPRLRDDDVTMMALVTMMRTTSIMRLRRVAMRVMMMMKMSRSS